MVDAGLDVTVMAATTETREKIVLLVNASKRRLITELQQLNGEREGFSNRHELRVLEKMWESELVDDLLFDRPAWHRNDPVKGRVIEAQDYEKYKWEGHRYMTYADEIQCLTRIIRGERNPSLSLASVPGVTDEEVVRSQQMMRGAGIS